MIRRHEGDVTVRVDAQCVRGQDGKVICEAA